MYSLGNKDVWKFNKVNFFFVENLSFKFVEKWYVDVIEKFFKVVDVELVKVINEVLEVEKVLE